MKAQQNSNPNGETHNQSNSHNNNSRGGRPRSAKGMALTKTMSTKLTVAEWRIAMVKIEESGMKKSEFLRELIKNGKVIARRTKEDRQQIRMLEGGLNNLNQLTRMAHIEGVHGLEERLNRVLDEIEETLKGI